MTDSAAPLPTSTPPPPESAPASTPDRAAQARHAIVIDDEPANRDFLERLMGLAGFAVTGAGSAEEALRKIAEMPRLALALIDQELPDIRGVDLIRSLRSGHADSLLVMATMHDGRDLIEEAFAAGVDVYLVKPHGFMELFKRLKETASDVNALRRLVIDQYGPRPFKGLAESSASSVPPAPPAPPEPVPPTPAAGPKPDAPAAPKPEPPAQGSQ